MKKQRKTLWGYLFLALSLSLLVACSDKEEAGKPAEPAKELTIVNGKIDPPVPLTMVRSEDPTITFKNGENYMDNVHLRWAKDALGVEIKTLWTASSLDYDTKLKLMLSSGDKMPDLFVAYASQSNTINTFIDSGKLLDVSEAFDKYASDTWKAALAEEPTSWYPFIKDGKKFAIPVLRPTAGSQSTLWIRQDWLDKLKLKAPTNLEELEKIMDAFVNLDPDGNGKKDTVALELAMKDQVVGSPVGDTSWFFGMFGAIPERWYPGADGKLKYGSVQPEVKAGLSKLNEWMNKGYIASDIALHDFNKVSENVASGKVGMLGGESWMMSYPGSLLLASDPKAYYNPYPIPQGVDGKNMRTIADPYTSAILINKDISEEALQAFFHYQNALYEAYNSDEPTPLKAFQEGYDYVIENGKASMDESKITGGKVGTAKYTLTGADTIYPSRILEASLKMAKNEKLTNQDLAALSIRGVIGNDVSDPISAFTSNALLVTMEQKDADIPEYFQGPSTKTMLSRQELLNKMQMDTYIEIIYGKKPIDEFDSFVAKWRSSGGDNIIKEVNEWYDTVKHQ
ncbi:extracellular solute-binding protein [Paenibacillus polysaccharolyticus]|uniref:extracellular solute-binding protein n=1 Tax=Paenibacillus polysaccharolyticus TaxID=582692 RepID=UPI0020A118C4|nr:extracellular solute-binding protein [Paenibacillus polysaccharolyticus]MCP1133680.1 extracellular solute-binding protein [Paenibacillus polysaccharolyticus]